MKQKHLNARAITVVGALACGLLVPTAVSSDASAQLILCMSLTVWMLGLKHPIVGNGEKCTLGTCLGPDGGPDNGADLKVCLDN